MRIIDIGTWEADNYILFEQEVSARAVYPHDYIKLNHGLMV